MIQSICGSVNTHGFLGARCEEEEKRFLWRQQIMFVFLVFWGNKMRPANGACAGSPKHTNKVVILSLDPPYHAVRARPERGNSAPIAHSPAHRFLGCENLQNVAFWQAENDNDEQGKFAHVLDFRRVFGH